MWMGANVVVVVVVKLHFPGFDALGVCVACGTCWWALDVAYNCR